MIKLKKEQGSFIPDVGRVKCWVGIDQSYTGFAITAVGRDGYESRLYVLQGSGIDRLVTVRPIVMGFLDHLSDTKRDVQDVGMEGYSFASGDRAHMVGELGGQVKNVLWNNFRSDEPACYPLIPTPSQVKKYATGKGNASKAEVLLGVYKNFGVEFSDDNMADSYAIARIVAGFADTKPQREVVALVKNSREKPA